MLYNVLFSHCYLLILSLFLISLLVSGLYLTPLQMNSIVNLIKNKELTPFHRNKINNILYLYYEKFAIQKALEFKNFHKFKCKNIDKEDLIICSKIGLYKSITKYNGNSQFSYFANLYIKYELLNTLTQHLSFTSIPRNILNLSKRNLSNNDLKKYTTMLYPVLCCSFVGYNNWIFDKYSTPNENINYERNILLWQEINKLDPFTKRIIYLKYDFLFNKKCNNKYIAKITGYSEETIRVKINNSLKNIYDILTY